MSQSDSESNSESDNFSNFSFESDSDNENMNINVEHISEIYVSARNRYINNTNNINNINNIDNYSNLIRISSEELSEKIINIIKNAEEQIFHNINEKHNCIGEINSLYFENIIEYTNELKAIENTVMLYLQNKQPYHNEHDYITTISNILYFSKDNVLFKNNILFIKNEIKKYIENNYNNNNLVNIFNNNIHSVQNYNYNNYINYNYHNLPLLLSNNSNETTFSNIYDYDYSNIEEMNDVKNIVNTDIFEKITSSKYNENNNENNNDKCVICYEEFQNNDIVLNIPCKHLFHKACIKIWVTENSYKCPICKEKIAEYYSV
jgi:hypothetical protein